jgi:hypothetical protein
MVTIDIKARLVSRRVTTRVIDATAISSIAFTQQDAIVPDRNLRPSEVISDQRNKSIS